MRYLLPLFGGLGNNILALLYGKITNRVQWISCCYSHSDTLNAIPLNVDANSNINTNFYKTFVVKNTTNRDYSHIKLNFEFDSKINIHECASRTTDLYDINPVQVRDNVATVSIDIFNRGDSIMYRFILISDKDNNVYKVTVSGATGVKVKYKDKRHEILRNGRSNTLVINK